MSTYFNTYSKSEAKSSAGCSNGIGVVVSSGYISIKDKWFVAKLIGSDALPCAAERRTVHISLYSPDTYRAAMPRTGCGADTP